MSEWYKDSRDRLSIYEQIILNEKFRTTYFSYRQALFLAQEGKCFHCGGLMLPAKKGMKTHANELELSVEHLFPVAKYGDNKRLREKLVLAHRECNARRMDQEPSLSEYCKALRIIKQASDIFCDLDSSDISLRRSRMAELLPERTNETQNLQEL